MTNNVQIMLPLLEKTFCESDWQALKAFIEQKDKVSCDLKDYYTKKLLKQHFKITKPCKRSKT